MNKYICIHGHFYQPPRENPWLETIELQDSAYPFHDWNERINAECYAPNTASRILDEEERIAAIVNNYSKISFNFGPTLLAWLKGCAPDTYEGILEADRLSMDIFGGHGSALAQAYNHMIMPLANKRDKETQVIWGIKDFEYRFNRKPEGMWLPETAVDKDTLKVLVDHDIKFTILAPYQAYRFRKIGEKEWTDVTGGNIDPTRPYKIKLSDNKSMVLFFYDGPISQGIAFERLLESGETFAQRLINAFSEDRDWNQIVHIATDGETYGHHHHKGDMGLAYALRWIGEQEDYELINYSQYLDKHPVTHEVQIYEDTAWSCSHGIGRWKENCGCHTGGRADWNQEWRAPLRESLDWLRNEVEPLYEREAQLYFRNPWKARDDYIEVILDRSSNGLEPFLKRHARHEHSTADRIAILKLLEMQRHAMLMYTSCGWFFDEISGIETVQVIQYAGRVIQLAQQWTDIDLEKKFLTHLERAKSNIPEHKDGRYIYEKFVKPAKVDLSKVAAHYALSSVFEEYEEDTQVFQYRIDRFDSNIIEVGQAKLLIGHAMVTSEIIHESNNLSYAVVFLGDHNMYGGIRPYRGESEYQKLSNELKSIFAKADIPASIKFIDSHFGHLTYSVKELFRDEQRNIIEKIMQNTLDTAETYYRQMYEPNVPTMLFLSDLGVPLPNALRTAAEFVINSQLKQEIEHNHLDFVKICEHLAEAQQWDLKLDHVSLGHIFLKKFENVAENFLNDPDNKELLQTFLEYTELAWDLPFNINWWKVQNSYYRLLKSIYPLKKEQSEESDTADQWVKLFEELGQKLSIVID